MKSRPQDFVENTFTLVDKKTGIEYWLGNGFWFYGAKRPFEVSFSLYQKWRFYRVLTWLKENRVADLQGGGK